MKITLANSPPEISGSWRLVSPLCRPIAEDSWIVGCQILNKHVNILFLIWLILFFFESQKAIALDAAGLLCLGEVAPKAEIRTCACTLSRALPPCPNALSGYDIMDTGQWTLQLRPTLH